jgi:hypothetical protein
VSGRRTLAVRLLPVALFGALAPVGLGWLLTASANCTLASGCRVLGLPGVIGLHALGPAGAAVGATLGWGLVRAGRYPVPRALTAPSRATLAALAGVVVLAVALAPPLFAGALGVGPTAWFALAVPYAPTLVGYPLLFRANAALPPIPEGIRVAGAVLAYHAVVAAQVGWWYLLAAVVARGVRGARTRVGSARPG